jgi:hypothetical protein
LSGCTIGGFSRRAQLSERVSNFKAVYIVYFVKLGDPDVGDCDRDVTSCSLVEVLVRFGILH